MTATNFSNPVPRHSEAPASWNTNYIDPSGFVCQITLRANSGNELLEKANGALHHLVKSGCEPLNRNRKSISKGVQRNQTLPASKSTDDPDSHDPAWCEIHQCEMTVWEKDGRTWYSHKVNGEWCKGK